MSQRVGYDRELQIEWLNDVVELKIKEMSEDEIKSAMKAKLERALKKEGARKTTLVLSNTWIKVPEEIRSIRDSGLLLYPKIADKDRIWLHWGMLIISYPFFRDIAEIAGNLQRVQDCVSMEHIIKRFIEKWGSRTTTRRAIGRVIRSMNWWGILNKTKSQNTYSFTKKISTLNSPLQIWLISALIASNVNSTMSVNEALNSTILFPFKITIGRSDLRAAKLFQFYREGSGIDVISIK